MKRLKTVVDLENMSLPMPWSFNLKYVLVLTFALTFATVSFADSEKLTDELVYADFDIDGNDQLDALTDGLILLRSMFGLTEESLINGVLGDNAQYTSAVQIESRVASLGSVLDIDDNSSIDALTDGLIILRYLFGLRGETLITGVIASDAQRVSSAEVESYILTKVTIPDRPIIALSSTNNSVQVNNNISVSWNVLNSQSCAASGDWTGPKELEGSETIKVRKKGNNVYSLSCSGPGGTITKSLTISGSLDFTATVPESLADYEPFSIVVSNYTLDEDQELHLTVDQTSGKNILFSKTQENVFSARAPATYGSEVLGLRVKLRLGESVEETKEFSIPVEFNNVALKYDDFFEFNPSDEIVSTLENENYFVWDIMPFVRTERKTVPAGTTYCYPTPDNCSTVQEESLVGFIPADILAGDFDGDGDQDVLFVADIGDRVFKSLGSDQDKSYWSTIHILFNDGTGRLEEKFEKYQNGEPPRLPAPYHIEIADFNNDGKDDAFIASFGVPKLNENNTNYWDPYPHMILLSDEVIHREILISQNEPELQENPATENAFAHDASSGDVDGDGDIDVFMNAVVYFNDGNGNFDPIMLNQKEINTPCCGISKDKVNKTHAAASTIGDYNNDGVDDLVIFWSTTNEAEGNEWGAETWSSILLGPVDKENPIYLDSPQWKTLPDPFYGPTNANYNDAYSGDINGDGFDDIVVGSTRKTPYYAGRHVQILISNGDGTFVDETSSRFVDQPRSGLDPSLEGTGIGEGVITLQDYDGDGDLDIVDTQAIYGGVDFEIYPRVTLAENNGEGIFSEVSLDYFPNRAQFTLFDNALNWGFDGTKKVIRGVMVDLDGEGHLDYLSQIQGSFDPDTNILFRNVESFISSFTMMSKKPTGD